MNSKIAIGAALTASQPAIHAAASAVGIAKTGTAIGTLNGAAHASATAAWVGLGSMKAGLFVMGVLPAVGVLLLLDGLWGREYGTPLFDQQEEFWKRYEAECELDELKKTVRVDPDHRVKVKTTAASLAQLRGQFDALAVEHELYVMKKELGLL